MLPILSSLKNSISCSLKKINHTNSNDQSTNTTTTTNNKKSKIKKYPFDMYDEAYDRRKFFPKKKHSSNKSLNISHKNEQQNYDYYSEYTLKQRQSEINLHYEQPQHNFNKKSTNSKHACRNTVSTASLPIHFNESSLNLKNTGRHSKAASKLKSSFSSFFKKLSFFGLSKFERICH